MTITTKYNISDSVWIIKDNRPTQKSNIYLKQKKI